MFNKKCPHCGREFSFWDWFMTDAFKAHVEFCSYVMEKKPEVKETPKPIITREKYEEVYKGKVERPKPWPAPPPPRIDPPRRPSPTPRPSSGVQRTYREETVEYTPTRSIVDDVVETIIITEVIESVVDSFCDAVSSCVDED